MKPLFLFIAIGLLLLATPLCAQNGQVTGSIVDVTGAFIPRGFVSLDIALDEATLEQRTDERGRFRFLGLPPGEHRLTLRAPGFDHLVVMIKVDENEVRELPPIQVNLAPSGCFEARRDPDWTMFLPSGTTPGIAGRVVSKEGPIPNARISVSCAFGVDCYRNSWLATTDTDGQFEMAGLPPGRVVVIIERQGFTSLQSFLGVVAATQSSYTFRLRRTDEPVPLSAATEPMVCE